jgi:hypothetical protein
MPRLFSLIAALVLSCIVATASAQVPQPIKPDRSFELGEKATSAGGLIFDGKLLWVSAQSLGKDLLLSYTTDGKVEKRISFDYAGNIAGGLAYDGTDYLLLDYKNRIAMAGGVKFTGNGEIIRVDQHGDLETMIKLPSEQYNTFGLAFHKGDLYYAHSPTMKDNSTIYKVAAKAVIGEGVKVGYYVRALTSDGKSMWVSTPKHILRLSDSGAIAEAFEPPFAVAGIAHDSDGNLWALEHNKNVLHRFPGKKAKGK